MGFRSTFGVLTANYSKQFEARSWEIISILDWHWLSPDHKCVHGHLELKVEWKFFISNKKSGRKIHFLMSQMDQLKIENLILYNYKEKCGKTYKQEEESTEGVYPTWNCQKFKHGMQIANMTAGVWSHDSLWFVVTNRNLEFSFALRKQSRCPWQVMEIE